MQAGAVSSGRWSGGGSRSFARLCSRGQEKTEATPAPRAGRRRTDSQTATSAPVGRVLAFRVFNVFPRRRGAAPRPASDPRVRAPRAQLSGRGRSSPSPQDRGAWHLDDVLAAARSVIRVPFSRGLVAGTHHLTTRRLRGTDLAGGWGTVSGSVIQRSHSCVGRERQVS